MAASRLHDRVFNGRKSKTFCNKIALERFGVGVKHDDKAFFDMQRQLSDMKWLSGRNFGFADFCISSKVKRVSLNPVDKL